MKKCSVILLLVLSFQSCIEEKKEVIREPFNAVSISTIHEDPDLSIRAIEILDDGNLAFAANKNTYGLYDTRKKMVSTSKIEKDSLQLEFRAVAHTATDFFLMSVASPGLLYKTGDNGQMELVYEENSPLTFYDSMSFWNDQEGIAIGDATGNCLSIIVTRDGGHTWTKLSCDDLPKANEGNAAFAASNSNIAIVGEETWVATGGKVSNVLYSPDKGATWQIQKTPIVQGVETQGMYSIDFYDKLQGFAIGGDYTKPDDLSANKIRTMDGGKTWTLVAENKAPGYRSCIQYVPNGHGKELVATGFRGIDYSNDAGISWKHLSDEGFFTIRFLNDSTAFAAGSGRVAQLKFN